MEPAMARVLALSLIAPKLTESFGKISFWTSACTSSLQGKKKKKEDSSEMPQRVPEWHQTASATRKQEALCAGLAWHKGV